MKKLKHFLVLLGLMVFGLLVTPLRAQISEGGLPPTLQHLNSGMVKPTKAPYVAPIKFDVEKLRSEDDAVKAAGILAPLRAATIIPAEISMEKNGEWLSMPNGQMIWTMTIEAPGAIATMFYYDEFYIPEGGKFFIYNKEKTQVIGAYTSATNPKGKEFATELVAGDVMILEYVAPRKAQIHQRGSYLAEENNTQSADLRNDVEQPRIKISGIGYGYNHITIYPVSGQDNFQATGFGGSLPCQVNIRCSEGEDWVYQAKGTVRIYTRTPQGAGWCTGAIVNNTREDNDPLMLSAFHCFDGATEANLNQNIVYFNYEHTSCENSTIEPMQKTITGMQMLVNIPVSSGSDGSLLRLNELIPIEYDTYYNGWDRTDALPTSGVGIHHPSGDVKKIATYDTTPTKYTWNGQGVIGATDAHLRLKYKATVNGFSFTEGGSSGSPLFNQEGLIVGTLTGGPTINCSTAASNQSTYGRLWFHWDQYQVDPSQQMKTYLDPDNTGAVKLEGKTVSGDKYVANFVADRTTVWASESIAFSDMSFSATTYNWTFADGTPATSTAKYPVVQFNVPGSKEVKLVINQGTANEREKRMTVEIKDKKETCEQTISIGTGTEKSQFPIGSAIQQILSSSIYTSTELGGAGLIKSIQWEAGNSVSSPRTFYVYLIEVDESEHLAPTTCTYEISTSKATLVYQSASNGWVNDAGTVTVNLTTPFSYSGTKNLKVITRAVTSTVTRSAEVSYTEVNNAHQQWTGTSTYVYPSGDGTVNSNRPNIKFIKESECAGGGTLIADFIAGDGKETLLDAGFDSNTTFPPLEWNVRTPGASASKWIAANQSAAFNFSYINSSSIYSAFVAADNSNAVDTWLETPEISSLPTGATIEFYSFYEGSKLDKAQGSLHISTDGGTTWVPIWSTGNAADPNVGFKWRKESVDLSTYAGNNIRLAWRYEGQSGSNFGIDGVMLYIPSGAAAKVFEGEYLQFTDISQGPPVLWNWTFQGGDPASSDVQNPKVYYGVQHPTNIETNLNVTLDIRNNTLNPKTDTKTALAVTVVKRKPLSIFASEGGNYTLFKSYGQFLPPTGGEVEFSDLSTRFPSSWSWTTDGSNYTTQNAQHTYTTKGSYSVSLDAINAAGSDTKTEADYVKVGGVADIWNMPYGDPGRSAYSDAYMMLFPFYLTGSSPNTDSYAEKFEAPVTGGGAVTSVKILFVKGANSNSPYTVAIRGGSGASTVLASVELSPNDVVSGDYTTVTFDDPVYVSGEFFVSVSGFKYSMLGTGNSAVYTSERRADGNCTAYALYAGTWYKLDNLYENASVSLNIVPTFEYSELEVTPGTVLLPAAASANNTLVVTSNVEWEATTDAEWITLTAATGTDDGSIKFDATENFSFERSGIITVSGGGIVRTIVVKQAAAATPALTPPSTLTATVIGAEENDVLLTWTDMTTQSAIVAQPDAIVGLAKPSSVVMSDKLAGLIEYAPAESLALQDQLMNVSATEKVLRWDNGIVYSRIRFTDGSPIEIAILWDPTDLHMLNGTIVKEFIIYCAVPAADYQLYIYEGGTQVYSQVLTGLTLGFNRIALTTPHTIDASQELMVTCKMSNYGTEYVAPYDAGPAVSGKGDLYLEGTVFAPTGLAGNWSMGIVVENKNAISYAVYRDGVKIVDNLTEPTYTDKNLPYSASGNCYYVTSYYHKVDQASAPSNTACVNLKVLLTARVADVTRYVGEANPAFTISYTGLVTGYDASTIDTPPVATCEANASYPAGTYPITLSGGSDNIYRFTYVPGTLTVVDTPAPLGLAATLENHTNVKLTWTAIAGVTGLKYKIFRDGVMIKDNLSATTVTYTDTDVESGPHYYTIVAVYKTGVESDPSAPANIFVDRAPIGLTAVVQNDVDVQLDWTSAGSDLSIRYNVYRDGVKIATEISEASYLDLAVAEGAHAYKVSAVHAGVETELSAEEAVFIKHLITVVGTSYARNEGVANPAFTATVTGTFVGADTADDVLALLTIACSANTSSPAGTYPITITAPTHVSYRFDISEGTLIVLPNNLTAIVENDVNVRLTWPSAGSDLSIRYNVYRDGAVITQVSEPTYLDMAVPTGSHTYQISVVYEGMGESTKSDPQAVFIKHLINVVGASYTRYEGQANPTFTVTVTGDFVGGDTSADILPLLTVSCAATTASPAGVYPITITAPVHAKYRFEITNGMLTVEVSSILAGITTLVAEVINDTDVLLEWDASAGAAGYNVYRDNVNVGFTTGTTYKDGGLIPGLHSYDVKVVNVANVESASSNPASAFIKYILNVSAPNLSRYVGEQNPAFTLTYGGFVGGDTDAVLTAKPIVMCAANAISPTGTYDIIVNGGESDKYRFVYNNGTLTITTAPINIETNAFTPYEKDGINDVFMPGATIEVVNRYGQSVFKGNNGWDGTRKGGQLVPPGSYYYKATLSDGRVLRGSVEVVKK